jgi:hypothetical protein
MVRAIDTIFFAALTMVSDAGNMVFFTHTIVSIPEIMIFSNEKIIWTAETIFLAT